jgi:hypothetical protein
MHIRRVYIFIQYIHTSLPSPFTLKTEGHVMIGYKARE